MSLLKMYKYSPTNSSISEEKKHLPRIRNMHFLNKGTPSPTSSRNTSFTQASFTIAPQKRTISIPRLNTRTVLSSKNRSVERNAGDLEYLDDYK